MNRRARAIGEKCGLAAVIACAAAIASCGAPEIGNAPPGVAEDCRQEVSLLTAVDPELAPEQSVPGEAGEPTDEVLDDVRAAREEADSEGIIGWPEDALLYRCLVSRGVELTPEQARVLAEWEQRAERKRQQ